MNTRKGSPACQAFKQHNMETRIHGGLSQDLGKILGSTEGILTLQAIV